MVFFLFSLRRRERERLFGHDSARVTNSALVRSCVCVGLCVLFPVSFSDRTRSTHLIHYIDPNEEVSTRVCCCLLCHFICVSLAWSKPNAPPRLLFNWLCQQLSGQTFVMIGGGGGLVHTRNRVAATKSSVQYKKSHAGSYTWKILSRFSIFNRGHPPRMPNKPHAHICYKGTTALRGQLCLRYLFVHTCLHLRKTSHISIVCLS